MLSSYRVVELSDEPTTFCGYLFALLGAEVICVEPPEGSAVRSIPPFSAENGESLWWQAYARGKTKITLDLQKGSDLDHLHQLVAGAGALRLPRVRAPARN